jgi:pyrroloquinoline quinone biosynthesis protein B|tara:strand:- start:4062 stop:5018 length:957 start_codon:yes stop_codon:yes gene_type:complete
MSIIIFLSLTCMPLMDVLITPDINPQPHPQPAPFLVVLGNVQDGGSPHIGCTKSCCAVLWGHPDPKRKVTCLGLVDPVNEQSFIFEATPDFPEQLKALHRFTPFQKDDIPNGIFLTHAHIGHYSGLMYLGKEAFNSHQTEVFVMPKMQIFLEKNGPWNQLINEKNIEIQPLTNQVHHQINSLIKVKPFLIPHRDEYSETVGYQIEGPNKTALFIPDIDKWHEWGEDITHKITLVDYAFIDGTFLDSDEINHRDISEIPHPFISETMDLFSSMPLKEKNKIYFIHLNHTNPGLDNHSEQAKKIRNLGFHVAHYLEEFPL